jgi:DNA-binding transcriptional LysR family regulator
MATLHDSGSSVLLEGIERIGLAPDRVPDLAEVNRRLAARTGWAAVGVGGFIPAPQFFRSLSQRRFPTTLIVRPRAQVVTICQQRPRKSGPADGGTQACTRAARFESGNLETLKRLVERGNGMTLLPALAVADLATAAQRKLVIPFADPAPSRDFSVARRRTHFRQPLVTAVLSIIMEVAATVLGTV